MRTVNKSQITDNQHCLFYDFKMKHKCNMYDTSLQRRIPSFAPEKVTYTHIIYGDNLFMHYHLPLRPRRVRPHRRREQ